MINKIDPNSTADDNELKLAAGRNNRNKFITHQFNLVIYLAEVVQQQENSRISRQDHNMHNCFQIEVQTGRLTCCEYNRTSSCLQFHFFVSLMSSFCYSCFLLDVFNSVFGSHNRSPSHSCCFWDLHLLMSRFALLYTSAAYILRVFADLFYFPFSFLYLFYISFSGFDVFHFSFFLYTCFFLSFFLNVRFHS